MSASVIAAIAAAFAVAGTAVSLENAEDAQVANERASRKQDALRERQRLAERRRVIRETRLRTGIITAEAQSSGSSGGSGAQSGIAVTNSNAANFVGQSFNARKLSLGISRDRRKAAKSSFRSSRALMLGELAGNTILNLGSAGAFDFLGKKEGE